MVGEGARPLAASLLPAGERRPDSQALTGPCSPPVPPPQRICFEEDDVENLIEPCECRADLRYAHRECCQQWISLDRGTGKKNETCEICLKPWKVDFEIPEVKTAGQHRYERLMHTLTVAYFRKVCGTASAREMHALVTIGPHIRGGWTEWLQERERKMQTPLYKFQSWWSNKTKGWRQRRASAGASDSEEEEEEDGAEEAGGGLAGRRDSSGCGCCTPSSVPAASDSENPFVAAAAGLGPRPPPGRVQVRGLAPAAAPAEAAGEGEAEASAKASAAAEDRGGQGQEPEQGGGGSCTAACCAEEAPSAPGPSTSAAPEPCREGCCKEEEEVEAAAQAQESPLPNVSAQSRAMPPLQPPLEVQE